MNVKGAFIVAVAALVLLGGLTYTSTSEHDAAITDDDMINQRGLTDLVTNLGDGPGKAGLRLVLDDEAGFDILKRLLNALPADILAVISENDGFAPIVDSDTFEEYVSNIVSDPSESLNLSGELYLIAEKTDTSSGTTIDVRASGSLKVDYVNALPDEGTYASNMVLTGDACLSISYGTAMEFRSSSLVGDYNRTYSDDRGESRVEKIHLERFVGIDGLTSADMDAIFGGGDPVVRKVTGSSYIVEDTSSKLPDQDAPTGFNENESHDVRGYDYRGDMEITPGMVAGTDSNLPDGSLEIDVRDYNSIEQFFEKHGIFVSSDLYNAYMDVIKGIASTYGDGIGFFYERGGDSYNTGIIGSIEEKLPARALAVPSVDVEGDYEFHYYSNPVDGGVVVRYLESAPSDMPTEIRGLEITESDAKVTINGIHYDIWPDDETSSNGILYTVYRANVTGADDGLNSATLSSVFEYDGKQVYLQNIYSLELESLTLVGGFFALNGCDIGILTLDGASCWFNDGISIENITIRDTEPFYIDFDQYNGISGLKTMVIEGPASGSEGEITTEGYVGPGMSVEPDQLSYEWGTVWDTESETSTIGLTATSINSDVVTVKSSKTVAGAEYPVDYYWVNDWSQVSEITFEAEPVGDFGYSQSLTSVTFDNETPIDIDSWMFHGCSNLESVIFEGPVNNIHDYAFAYCNEISNITFASDVDWIGWDSFDVLPDLTTLVFGGDVGLLETEAFGGCQSLRTVDFEGNVDKLYLEAFIGCESLTSIKVLGNVNTISGYKKVNLQEFSVAGTIHTIERNAFKGSIGSFHAGSIDVVGENAFYKCDIGTFTVGSIGFVDENAFHYDATYVDELKEVTQTYVTDSMGYGLYSSVIEGSVEYDVKECKIDGVYSLDIVSIRSVAEEGTWDIESLIIPEKLTINVDGLPSERPVGAISWVDSGFNDQETNIGSLTIHDNIKYIGPDMHEVFGTGAVSELHIDSEKYHAVKSSGINTVLETVVDPDGGETKQIVCVLNGVDTDVFVVPEGVTYFDTYLLYRSSVKTLDTNDVISLDMEYLMSEGDNIVCLKIGSSLRDLGWAVPLSLESIIVDSSNEHFIESDGALYSIIRDGDSLTAELRIYPPAKAGEEFMVPKTIELNGSDIPVLSIAYNAFEYTKLKKVVIQDNITHLDTRAFMECGCEEIILPDSIQSIDNGVFADANPMLNVHSASNDVVWTENGAIYFREPDQSGSGETHLRLVSYHGDGETLVVRDGTESVTINGNRVINLKLIVLPETLTELTMFDADWASDTMILMPSVAVVDDYYDSYPTIRTYETSEHYSISFSIVDGGIRIDVVSSGSYCTIDSIEIDGASVQNNSTIALDTMFPVDFQGTVIDGRVDISFTIPKYDVTFEGIPGDTDNIVNVWHGDRVNIPAEPERGGYIFDGWFSDSACQDRYDFETPVTADMILYAKWIPLCIVTFNTPGVICYFDGSVVNVDSLTVAPGEMHTVYVEVENGYMGDPQVFAGDVDVTYSEFVIDSNVEITVKGVSKTPETCTLTLVNDGSKGTGWTTKEVIVPYGEGYALPEITANDGYRFVGWTYSVFILPEVFYPTADCIITAEYLSTSEDVTVTFVVDPNRGKLVGSDDTVVVKSGVPMDLPDVKGNKKWEFIGWSYDGSTIVDSYTPWGDVTLYAFFEAFVDDEDEVATVNLVIHNEMTNYNGQKSYEVVIGEEFHLPTLEGKRGYTFMGWAYDESSDVSISPEGSFVVEGNITLTAIFQKLELLTVNLFAGTGAAEAMDTKLAVYPGDSIDLPDVTASSNYRFDGWYDGSVKVASPYTVTKNVTLVAKMTYVSPGGSGGSGGSSGSGGSGDVPGGDDAPEEGVVNNPDGSTTTTSKNDDGTFSKVTEKTDGNTTTKVEEALDKDGNLLGSTETVTEKGTTESGSKVDTTTETVKDSNGNETSKTTTVKAESEDGNITTESKTSVSSDGSSKTASETKINALPGDDGVVSVSDDDVDAAIRQMDEVVSDKDAEKKISIESPGYDADNAYATLSPDSLSKISESGAELEISGEVGKVSLDKDVSKTLASSEEDVSVSISTAKKTDMTPKQQDRVGDSVVFELSATSGSKSIHELGGQAKITVPYTLAEGQDPEHIVVFFVNDEGKLYSRVTSYDPVTHTVTFYTDHFSYYMIGTVSDIEDTEGSGMDTTTIAIVAAVAAAVVVVAVVAVKRH